MTDDEQPQPADGCLSSLLLLMHFQRDAQLLMRVFLSPEGR